MTTTHTNGESSSAQSSEMDRDSSLSDIEGNLLSSLQHRLSLAESQVSRTLEENTELKQYVEQLNKDLMDLHAELFAEANKQVCEAQAIQERAERHALERDQENSILRGEVTALKTLLITSTPSLPNRHLHPQLAGPGSAAGGSGGATAAMSSSATQHRRNSAFSKVMKGVEGLLTGKRESSLDTSTTQLMPHMRSTSHHEISKEIAAADEDEHRLKSSKIDISHVDPKVFQSFQDWLFCACPLPPPSQSLDSAAPAPAWRTEVQSSPSFPDQILHEDVLPCLTFRGAAPTPRLTHRLLESMPQVAFEIDPIPAATADAALLRCSLVPGKPCSYRLVFKDDSEGDRPAEVVPICSLARNRIVSVCNLYTYLSLIGRGLLKSAEPEAQFRSVQRYRRDVALARLGFEPLLTAG